MIELEHNPNIRMYVLFYDYNINKTYIRKFLKSIHSDEFYIIGDKFIAFSNDSDLLCFKLSVKDDDIKTQTY